MPQLHSKSFNSPDEVVTLPGVRGEILVVGEWEVARYTHEPGWCWSKDVKQIVGTPSCQYHHQGVLLSGLLQVTTDDGGRTTLSMGDAFDIPPGHDACVLGDQPVVSLEFRGFRGWGKPPSSGDRVLATLLFTDIVASTAIAARLGDEAWKALLSRHYDLVRAQLDQYRGIEVDTAGDGLLAQFDGAARAVRCAEAIHRVALRDGVQVRSGIHSGEVERHPHGLTGIAVHIAARIMGLAAPGQVIVSASTVALLEGSGLSFDDAGEHQLKGVEGTRKVFRLSGEA